mmetsp:Transcript_5877/g.8696  ORF Transcript_5877/g.8696 Transcript_5877/m.8696 type:complete len:83 (-) Transcript_5877:1265-1513(-)
MVYSGDTLNHAPSINKMYEQKLLSKGRLKRLLNFPWHHDVILHECGVPPIHTPAETLYKHDKKVSFLVLLLVISYKFKMRWY